MAVVTFLHSTAKLAGSIGDVELFENIENMIQELIENHNRADHAPA